MPSQSLFAFRTAPHGVAVPPLLMPRIELSLFSGYGGLGLGLKLALPSIRTVCYVERDAFAASILVARMEDALLDPAPVWDDVATFDGGPWRGTVDLVSGGFPCQDISLAGKGGGSTESAPGSGSSTPGSFATWSPGSSSWRTSGRFSLAVSTAFSGLWPISGSMRSGVCSARRRSARPTSGSGSSSWPTPVAQDSEQSGGQGSIARGARGDTLTTAARCWATPKSKDWRAPGTAAHLAAALAKNKRGQDLPEEAADFTRRAATTTPDGEESAPTSSPRSRLNPLFVEWLMGLPENWTEARDRSGSGCAATESFPTWLRARSWSSPPD